MTGANYEFWKRHLSDDNMEMLKHPEKQFPEFPHIVIIDPISDIKGKRQHNLEILRWITKYGLENHRDFEIIKQLATQRYHFYFSNPDIAMIFKLTWT